MEMPDILRSLWIGAARDAIGAFMLDLCEHDLAYQDYETWDERLQALTLDARDWCRGHKFAPSLVDDFSSLSISFVKTSCFTVSRSS